MPNGVMSFPSNHEFNVKTQIVHVIKKAKSLHQNKKFWAKPQCSLWSHFKGVRTISKLYMYYMYYTKHIVYK